MPKSGNGDGISIGVEGSDDGSFVVFCRCRVWVLSGGSNIAKDETVSASSRGKTISYAHADERIEQCDHRIVMHRLQDDSGRNFDGDHLGCGDPTTNYPSDQNSGE